MNKLILGAAVAAFVGLANPASALTTFFGEDLGLGENTRLSSYPNALAARNSFHSNLTGVGVETFESFTTDIGMPLNSTFAGSQTATLTGTGNIRSVPTGTNGFGRYPISGNKFLETASNFTVTFTTPVAAFGFYGVDIGDFNGQVTLTLVSGGSQTLNIGNSTNVAGGGVLYFGVIDTANPFTSIQFGNTNSGTDILAFDDMSVGTVAQVMDPVPEPMTLGLGLAGLIGAARRRRNRR